MAEKECEEVKTKLKSQAEESKKPKAEQFNKYMFAIRIGIVRDILAFQVRSVGMHDDAGLHVVDPEIVFELRPVAQPTQI